MTRKLFFRLLLLVVLVVAGAATFLLLKRPDMAPAPGITVARTPERIARGKYLFHVVSSCWDCHSEVDESRFGGPLVPDTLGKGKAFPKDAGLPGNIVAPNLTPDSETGAGNWTDGQLIRAIREGIGNDDRVLFPFMPYTEFAHMSDEDVQSLVAYIRTLSPVTNPLPKTTIDFPVSVFIKFAPKPVGSVPQPDHSDRVAYGKYLTRIGGCYFCHTPAKNDQPIPGKDFAGGHEFQMAPGARVVSYNLTPDLETGTGKWTELEFLDKFYQYKDYAEKGSPKVERHSNTVMPWLGHSQFQPDDLKAIFAYLRTVPPQVNAVVTKPDAPENRKDSKK